jgi:hypothetical protein
MIRTLACIELLRHPGGVAPSLYVAPPLCSPPLCCAANSAAVKVMSFHSSSPRHPTGSATPTRTSRSFRSQLPRIERLLDRLLSLGAYWAAVVPEPSFWRGEIGYKEPHDHNTVWCVTAHCKQDEDLCKHLVSGRCVVAR